MRASYRAPAGASIEFPWEALRPERRVQTSRMGSNAFRVDIPNYLELCAQGRLRLDETITRRLPPDGVNDAFRAMYEGAVARTLPVFRWPPSGAVVRLRPPRRRGSARS